MDYEQIFRDVSDSITQDYAGFAEKKSLHDPGFFYTALQAAIKGGQADDRFFVQLMGQYLAVMQDINLSFALIDRKNPAGETAGFDVRSQGGRLYVVRAEQDKRFRPGDQILTLGKLVPALYRQRMGRNVLGDDVEERENWGPVVQSAGICLVKHRNGIDESLRIKSFPVKKKLPALSGRKIGADTLYLNLPHFARAQEVARLLEAKKKSLEQCSRLILDLRRCAGGDEEAFLPLLDYVFPEPVRLASLYDEPGLFTNYTERNCRRKEQMLKVWLQTAGPDASAPLRTLIQELSEKAGQGMIWEPDEELRQDTTMVGGRGNFRKVILLTDVSCTYAGETFVSLCRKSPRTEALGRPTGGSIDYCNPVSVSFDGRFVFTYPMSKTQAAAEGRGLSGRGLAPDLYIPWSEQECTEDKLLQEALTR